MVLSEKFLSMELVSSWEHVWHWISSSVANFTLHLVRQCGFFF